MVFVVSTLIALVVLFGLEALFRLRSRGRRILVGLYLVWVLVDAIGSAHDNPDGASVAFLISAADSLVPLVLWYWISTNRWLRQRGAEQE